MKIKLFFFLKFCELGSKVQNMDKKSMFTHSNRIEPSSILVQFGSQGKMRINLLQKTYDNQTEMFINGVIDYDFYQALEREFLTRYELFTIYLN
jgi:hypothetical protein